MFLADLHGGGNLEGLSLTNQVADGWAIGHDLKGGNSARLIFARKQCLSDDATKRIREHGPNLSLLVIGKDVNNTINGLCGAVGVKCTKNQVSSLGRSHGELNCFQVAHLSHKHNVRI